jgi:hypothetical protein
MTDSTNGQSPPPAPEEKSGWGSQRIVVTSAAALGGILVLLFLLGLVFALFTNAEVTAPRIQIIRDLFIIAMALEGLLIIAAFAIMILQFARLVNLVRSEIKPILQNTQEAVNSARGTVEFVGTNVAEPIIRLSTFLAGLSVLLRELGGIRRAIRKDESSPDHLAEKDTAVEPDA